MAKMVRKQVYIEPRQEALLKQLTQETGATEAELIRQAIDHQMKVIRFPKQDLRAWQEERAFITRLIQKGPTPGGRSWRREDLHER
jgi:hypothetical protein